ncbi:ABC transporter permease [Gordonia polyisoprenivorans]|uniref:ABC transporter permease n=1 Tax=Gordonia polyisoprenivorans TaxID=84595 RepID=UPI000B99DDD8|nr:ABC transporter permease [Gordonia polyisoprenivorans]MBE7195124.1 ABC transporter permease [Gordonia polyisoprenivorans]OZC30545.1 peptide ABC transporter permease [Gordonia polyisoprenivorans]QUD85057.1 ABC transporter permease [Gordonia polyisoprenivorans]WCB39579.1 ABC transporter permease [Gordonia polyisoprenivorans]
MTPLTGEMISAPAHPIPAAPRRPAEWSPRALLSHTVTLTARTMRRWLRDPASTSETILVPVAFLVALNIVLGDGITRVTGIDALYGSVPLVAMVAATQGATVGGLSLMHERDSGLLARLWVLPINRAAGVISRLLAETIRIVVATLALLIAGYAMGFRFHEGVAAAIGWVFVPCLFGLAFAVGVATLALYSAKTIVVEATALVSGVFMFFSTGFVPLHQYPEWIQPAVSHQPLSYTVDTMKGLSVGGPVATPLTGLLAWSVSIIVVCAIPLALGYRKASMHS